MKPTIESLHNPKVKQVVRLRDSRFRRRTGQILIDGVREIDAARRAGIALEAIYCAPAMASFEAERGMLPGWPVELIQPVSERVLEKLTYGQRNSQAVAVASAPTLELERLQLPSKPLIIVLDQAEKPGNIGAVARTLATAGADALVLTDPNCEVFNPNAIRASLGTIFSLPIAVVPADRFRTWIDERSIGLVRACVDGAVNMWVAELDGPLAIVLGSEAHGLGKEWNRTAWPAVQIPMRPGADSLNLSVSAGVLCYEALRQRRNGCGVDHLE